MNNLILFGKSNKAILFHNYNEQQILKRGLTLKIAKIINNNIISSFDSENREVVVMGRGIGFGKRPSQEIDQNKVEKVFRMESDDETRRLQDLLIDIPLERVQLVNKIIHESQKLIVNKLHKNVYITLIDHINFVIERYNNNIQFQNPLLMDIKRCYPNEYKAGALAVSYINKELSLELTDDEAASIAMHFINAELGMDMPETIDMAKIIQNVVKIIKTNFSMELNEESIDYERFITHIKFLAQRIVTKRHLRVGDKELNLLIQIQYPKEYACTKKIKHYIEKAFEETITDDEMTFLAIHIKRITMAETI